MVAELSMQTLYDSLHHELVSFHWYLKRPCSKGRNDEAAKSRFGKFLYLYDNSFLSEESSVYPVMVLQYDVRMLKEQWEQASDDANPQSDRRKARRNAVAITKMITNILIGMLVQVHMQSKSSETQEG
jgi:hypothetical protein